MKLVDDFKDILLKAWSVRFILLAGALSGIEVILPNLTAYFPDKTFVILSALVTCFALVARVVAQPSTLPKDTAEKPDA